MSGEAAVDTRGARSSSEARTGEELSIRLPHQSFPVERIGLDIGGTLCKLVHFVPGEKQDGSHDGGLIAFAKFSTEKVEECISFIKGKGLSSKARIFVSGGGAFKFYSLLERELGVPIHRVDEMASLVGGLNFLLLRVHRESYRFDLESDGQLQDPLVYADLDDKPFPYLLVNIGTGVSIIKVNSCTSYERVSGSSLGGGTFMGLCELLTGETDFNKMIELGERGDSRNVDMLVGDIYGDSYAKIGLDKDIIASSMGFASQTRRARMTEQRREWSKADIADSLLRMIGINIGQIAYLTAVQHNLSSIYFGGFFIRGHRPSLARIAWAINFWSKGSMTARFLRHDGFLGALGAFFAEEDTLASKESASAAGAQAQDAV